MRNGGRSDGLRAMRLRLCCLRRRLSRAYLLGIPLDNKKRKQVIIQCYSSGLSGEEG